jgi:hypothetical protein
MSGLVIICYDAQCFTLPYSFVVLEIYVKYFEVSSVDECREFYTDIAVYSCLPILECPRIKACTTWDYYYYCCCWVQESFAFTELCSAYSMPVGGLIWQLCVLRILWLYPCVDSHEVVLVSCCSVGHRISPGLRRESPGSWPGTLHTHSKNSLTVRCVMLLTPWSRVLLEKLTSKFCS